MQRNQNSSRYLKLLGGALLVIIIPGIVAPVIAADAPAATTQAKPETVALTVVARDGVKNTDPSIGQLDLGNVDSLSTPKIEQDFILRNDRKAPITIGRLQPTCGCTSVILGEGAEATKTLGPSEEVKVRVAVDVTRFHGPIHKAVRAYSADGTTLLATLEITADIQDPVVPSTRQIDLGRVNYGTAVVAPLTVTLSPSLKGDYALELVSSDANVSVSPSTEKPAPGANPLERRFDVSISPKAPIGLISSTLTFVLPEKDAVKVTEPGAVPATPAEAPDKSVDARVVAALQSTQVYVNAEIVGNLRATPAMVVFGKQSVQRVTLTGNTAAALKGLKLSSASPWVKTRLLPAAKPVAGQNAPAAAKTAVYELTLDPHAPAGTLETQILVTAADGERLSLQVLADIIAPPPTVPVTAVAPPVK